MTDSIALRNEWLEHPHFKYRGCAPDADDPSRMAGDLSLPVGAHHAPDAWVPEGQRERVAREDAAIEVCLGCPVMVQCDAYASSVVMVGDTARLAEPDGVWGGRRALERHRAFIAQRHAVAAAPDRRFRTPQKQAVLKALASCWDPFEVAAASGVDVRTANWQRSSLVRLLGLPKDVSRMRALEAARGRGLLEDVAVVADDGSVPAVPPPTRVPTAEPDPDPDSDPGLRPESVPAGLVLPDADQAAPESLHRGVRSRRRGVAAVSGQLSLDDALTPTPTPAPAPAPVVLFPASPAIGVAA